MGTLLHKVGHGLAASDTIMLANLAGGDGLSENTLYYVLAAGLTADDFAVSLTDGGSAIAFTTDVTDGSVVYSDTYEQVDDGNMSPPDPPGAGASPTLSSSVITSPSGASLVELKIVAAATTAPIRLKEVQVTREISGGDPVWTTARVIQMAHDSTDLVLAAVGNTLYYARVRYVDVYGQAGAWGTAIGHTTTAGPDSTGVQNTAATVTIEDDGLHIYEGALSFEDDSGTTVLNGAGFGPAWRRFITSRVYNGDFYAATPTPASEIDNSTNPLKQWSYGKVSGTAITGKWVADSSAASGGKLTLSMASGSAGDQTYIEQMIAVNGSGTRSFGYVPGVAAKFTAASDTACILAITTTWYKKDGTTTTGSSTTVSVTAADMVVGSMYDFRAGNFTNVVAPADAYYLKVRVALKRDTAANSATAALDVFEVILTELPSLAGIVDNVDPTYGYLRLLHNNSNAQIVAGYGTSIKPELRMSAITGAVELRPDGDGTHPAVVFIGAVPLRAGGTSFPASPTTGDLYYRTDLAMWFYFDGTRWLCTCPHTLTLGDYYPAQPFTVTGTIPTLTTLPVNAVGTILDIWLVGAVFTTYVSTTNDGTKYWTVALNADGLGTLASFTTAADTVNAQTRHRVTIGAVASDASANLRVWYDVTKTSTPGGIYAPGVLEYRFIAT